MKITVSLDLLAVPALEDYYGGCIFDVQDKTKLDTGEKGVCFQYRKYTFVNQLWVYTCQKSSSGDIVRVEKDKDQGWKAGISTATLGGTRDLLTLDLLSHRG